MITNTLINMFLDDFDSTDELETMVIFALEEEQLNNERRSKISVPSHSQAENIESWTSSRPQDTVLPICY